MSGLIALIVFAALVLLIAWYARNRNDMEDRVRELSAPRREAVELDDPFTERIMAPTVHGITTRLVEYMPTSLVSRARKWLVISDSTMTLATFMSIVLVTSTAFPALVLLLLVSASGGAPSATMLLLVPLVALFGFLAPMMLLRRRAKNRQSEFWKSLPDSMDLLTTCVEAGVSLDYAFQRLAERQRGPIGEEVNRMLREKALGQTRREALTSMAERIDLPDVGVFVNSIIQAETLGTSIGAVLRTQSRQIRTRRRQRAEQVARQAAPKMVFPLVFFVMPSLFVVILGPVVINAYQVLRG
jgi:tight adherence protein C